jgi:hypothetical protein
MTKGFACENFGMNERILNAVSKKKNIQLEVQTPSSQKLITCGPYARATQNAGMVKARIQIHEAPFVIVNRSSFVDALLAKNCVSSAWKTFLCDAACLKVGKGQSPSK